MSLRGANDSERRSNLLFGGSLRHLHLAQVQVLLRHSVARNDI